MAGEKTINGKDYIMEIDTETPLSAAGGLAYRPMVCEVSSTFSITTEEQAVSNGCNGGWANSVPTTSAFSFSGEWQAINPQSGDPDAASMNEIALLAANKRQFWVRRKLVDGKTGVEIYREGRVWINQYEDTATTEDPFTFSADFVGKGEPIISGGLVGILYDSMGEPITKGDNLITVRT